MTSVADGVHFVVPDVFIPLDLGEDATTRFEGLLGATSTLTDEQRMHLAVNQEIFVEELRRSRVGYAATSLVRVDVGEARLSIAQFAAAVRPVPVRADVVLESMATHLAVPGLRRDVGFVSLPAGRALAVVEERRFRTGRSVLGRERLRAHVVHQIQLMLPFPDGRHLVVLSLSTESVRDTDAYLDLMGLIGRSVSFAPAAVAAWTPGSISDALGGGIPSEGG